MNSIFQYVMDSPFLQFLGYIAGLSGVLIGLFRWIGRKSGLGKTQSNLVKHSQEAFIWFNKNIIGKRRNEIAKLALISNHSILNDDGFINDYDNTPLLLHKSWLPEKPLDIQSIKIVQKIDVLASLLPPKNVLPLKEKGLPFAKFSHAHKVLLKPDEFEDNAQFRILKIRTDSKVPEFHVSKKLTSYFSKINYGKSLENEFVRALISDKNMFNNNIHFDKEPKHWKLTFRKKVLKKINCLSNFEHTILLGGISSLTLIFDEETENFRFLLHQRSNKQGYASGVKHVIPAGEYQPLNKSDFPEKDLPFWHNIMRELAEEVANKSEYKSKSGSFINYDEISPFKDYNSALEQGHLKVFYVGFGLDPLSLQGEILTVLCFKKNSFIKLFGDIPLDKNEEGYLIHSDNQWGLAFDQETIEKILKGNILAAGHSILSISKTKESFFREQMTN